MYLISIYPLMYENYIFLALGFALLFGSGHVLVESSAAMARRFNISEMIIGVTVVAFGTSAPELFVSLKAVFSGSADISISNVIGSNIANIALVLGFVAIVNPLNINKKKASFDWTVMMTASVLLYLFSILGNNLIWWEGAIFLLLLTWYMWWMVRSVRNESSADKKKRQQDNEGKKKEYPLIITFLLFAVSVAGLYYGSELLVNNARTIALGFEISERVVGVSVIAFGTSVPELATSIIAAFKKKTDISVGNIIGSNIFNILGILGITSTVKTLNVNPDFLSKDYLWMLGIALLLLLPIRRGRFTIFMGVVMVLLYITYMVSLF
jgi:cation:H+ antiporter